MNDLNDFNNILKSYIHHEPKADSEHRIIIDHRPKAIVGNMLLTKPTSEEDTDEYIVALIACIAEIIAPDVKYDVTDVAVYLASWFGEAIGELYAKAATEQEDDWF